MRLLFDARYIRTDFHDGISRYSAELAAAVAAAAPAREVDVAFLIHDEAQRAFLPSGARAVRIHAPTSVREPFTALLLNRYRPDALFSPMQTIGVLGRRFGVILTLHDTIYYRHRTPRGIFPGTSASAGGCSISHTFRSASRSTPPIWSRPSARRARPSSPACA